MCVCVCVYLYIPLFAPLLPTVDEYVSVVAFSVPALVVLLSCVYVKNMTVKEMVYVLIRCHLSRRIRDAQAQLVFVDPTSLGVWLPAVPVFPLLP